MIYMELKTDALGNPKLILEINDDNLFYALDEAAGDRPDSDEIRGHLDSFCDQVQEVIDDKVAEILAELAADYVSENHELQEDEEE